MTLLPYFTHACAAAALACQPWVGRGDKTAADQAAVDAMRRHMQTAPMNGRIVIGEGERDEAPMLHIGEALGAGGPAIDIAVDPLEGTQLCADNRPGALAVAAFARRGDLLHAPDVYMQKIAAGPGLDLQPEDLDRPFADVLARLAIGRPHPLRVVMLDRPRHAPFLQAAQAHGANLSLLADGDVMGALQTCLDLDGAGPSFDLYVGSGGAPEGVLAAAGLQHMGGRFFGRLAARNAAERARIHALGITETDRIYPVDALAKKTARLVMAGVTDHVLKAPRDGKVEVIHIGPAGAQRVQV